MKYICLLLALGVVGCSGVIRHCHYPGVEVTVSEVCPNDCTGNYEIMGQAVSESDHLLQYHSIYVFCMTMDKHSTVDTSLIYSIITRLLSVVIFATILLLYSVTPGISTLLTRCLMEQTALLISGDLLVILLSLIILEGADPFSNAIRIGQYLASYLYLASSTWHGLIGLELWRSTKFTTCSSSEPNIFHAYKLWGYGTPLVLKMIYDFNHDDPEYSLGSYLSWSRFFHPEPTHNLLVIAFWIWGLILLYKKKKEDGVNCTVSWNPFFALFTILHIIRYLYLVGLPVAHIDDNHVAGIAIFFQAIIMFIYLVSSRNRLLKLIAENKLFGFKWPATWKDLVDNEPNPARVEQVNEVELNSSNDFDTTNINN